MRQLERSIEAFVKLGVFFNDFCEYLEKAAFATPKNQPEFDSFLGVIATSKHHNGWFTQENVLFGLRQWSILLSRDALEEWVAPYSFENQNPKKVALIMAGNIPLVGFHDFLATLITGNIAIVKLSSNDKVLLPFIAQRLMEIEPMLSGQIHFADGLLKDFDAVIATGSNNTARYFEYYFSKKPNIIRKNRNSVAVLSGKETRAQLEALGEDIFRYFGLGCRSVSKLFVPRGYSFDAFFKAIFPFANIVEHAKYANNYDYNKAVYLMGNAKMLDDGFLLLKEDTQFASPIAVLFYEFYDSPEGILTTLTQKRDDIQCVVGDGVLTSEVAFGETQKPSLSDYADGVDTVAFLLRNEYDLS